MQQRGDLADPDALAYSLLAVTQGGHLLTQAHRDLPPRLLHRRRCGTLDEAAALSVGTGTGASVAVA
jgi:hypothetical protein